MKKLILILAVMLAACGAEYEAHYSTNTAYMRLCTYKTINTTINSEGDTVVLHSTCKKTQ